MAVFIGRVLLLALDLLLLLCCFQCGDALLGFIEDGRGFALPAPGSAWFNLLLFTSALWVVLATQEGLYRLFVHDLWERYFAALRVVAKTIVLLAVLLFLARLGADYSPGAAILSLLHALLLLPVARVLAQRYFVSRLAAARRTLLVGDRAGLDEFFSGATAGSQDVFGFCGILLARGSGMEEDTEEAATFQNNRRLHDLPLLGGVACARRAAERTGANQMLVCATHVSRVELSRILRVALGTVPQLFILPDLAALDIAEVQVGAVGSQPVLNFNQNLRSPFNNVMKRSIDVLVSLLALALLWPLLLALAAAIRLDSPGPVIYRHRRYGRDRRQIRLNKFRTMVRDADTVLEKLLAEDEEARREWTSLCKLKNDPRITRVGRVIRRLSLDELPQIVNVLKGEMSLVGPRPISDLEYDKYGLWQDNFMSVRPGLTGLWQVSGRSDLDFMDRVKLDMYYIRNWTIWLDLRIMLKTMTVFVSKEGAY